MPFIAYCNMQYIWKNSIEYSFLCVVRNFVLKMKRRIEVIQFRHNFSKFFLAFCSVKISLLDFSPNWKIHGSSMEDSKSFFGLFWPSGFHKGPKTKKGQKQNDFSFRTQWGNKNWVLSKHKNLALCKVLN